MNRDGRSSARNHDGTQPALTTLGEFGNWVQERLFFIDYSPVIFTSARTGFHLDRLLGAVRYVRDQMIQRTPTSTLNRVLRDAMTKRPPEGRSGRRLRVYYAAQVSGAPPAFLLFTIAIIGGTIFSKVPV